MFYYLNTLFWWLVLAGLVGAYYISVLLWGKRKIFPSFLKSALPDFLFVKSDDRPHFFDEIIDIPKEENFDFQEISLEEPEAGDDMLEMVVDADSVLLKEAEAVVEKIEETVQQIESSPPNPEEVYSKISSILRGYSIFLNTEYFEAINNFIRITVSRDCNIKWTEQELVALWK
jgi:hypothetical protein